MQRIGTYLLALLALGAPAQADDGQAQAQAQPPASFMKDVAPILVRSCIACHNARKSESKYNMTTFALLAKGGAQGEGITLEPGDPEASRFVELIRPNGQPRMPYKQDPLPPEAVATIERWVKEGAKYDGEGKDEDWVALLHKRTPVNVPEKYPVPVPITALAFSPDGQSIATSGYHEVNVWQGDGTLKRRLRGLPERVYDIAYSPDGKWLATAGGDPGLFGSVKLWVAEPDGGGKAVKDLLESNDSVFAVAFSPDSSLVAAAGADRAVRIWETNSGKLVSTIEDHADWVLDVAFSPDGTRLATASRDKTSKVFDLVKKESLVTFPGHGEAVYGVAFAPDGKTIATGGADNQVRLWRPDEDAKQTRNVGGFGGAVFRLAYANDGKAIVATGADKVVRVFNPNDGATIRNLDGQEDWTYALGLSPDGKAVAAGGWDGKVRLWSLADGKPAGTFVAAPGLK